MCVLDLNSLVWCDNKGKMLWLPQIVFTVVVLLGWTYVIRLSRWSFVCSLCKCCACVAPFLYFSSLVQLGRALMSQRFRCFVDSCCFCSCFCLCHLPFDILAQYARIYIVVPSCIPLSSSIRILWGAKICNSVRLGKSPDCSYSNIVVDHFSLMVMCLLMVDWWISMVSCHDVLLDFCFFLFCLWSFPCPCLCSCLCFVMELCSNVYLFLCLAICLYLYHDLCFDLDLVLFLSCLALFDHVLMGICDWHIVLCRMLENILLISLMACPHQSHWCHDIRLVWFSHAHQQCVSQPVSSAYQNYDILRPKCIAFDILRM